MAFCRASSNASLRTGFSEKFGGARFECSAANFGCAVPGEHDDRLAVDNAYARRITCFLAVPVFLSHRLRVPFFLMLAVGVPVFSHAAPTIGGCQIFPPNNVWNVPVNTLPLHANSVAFINSIGSSKATHMDFGSGLYLGRPIGIPFVTVPRTQPKVPITFEVADESDPGPYPIPPDVPIEGGAAFPDGDRHVIVVDTATCTLYETGNAFQNPANVWVGYSGAVFDLNSHALRPATWTSADAAGLPILPGLLRYDEVNSGEITHAVRFTAPQTRNAYVWPARHKASALSGTQYPPMGMRFRLRASYPESASFSAHSLTIIRALKKYGMMLADNGSSWYISGAPDDRWDNDVLHELDAILGSDYEAVETSSLIVNANSGQTNVGPLTVTGTINGPSGALAGVSFCGGAGVTCSATNASGNYSCSVPFGFSGRLYPRLTSSIFAPALTMSTVTANFANPTVIGRQPATCVMDADANNNVSAMTDGMLALRWMLGVTGTAATDGAIGASPARTDPAQIAIHLNAQRMDIDGDSSVDAVTDGLLLLRALLGFSGDAVIGGAVSPCATRNTWAAIRGHLAGICGLVIAP